MMTHLRWLTCLLVLGLASVAGAADKAPAKSLDDQLLDDLDTELLPATEKKPAVAKDDETQTPRASKRDDAGLDQKLLDEIEGEDIELGPKTDPLTLIGRSMRKVESLIDKRDTSPRTQEMQKEIVRNLDLLLEQTKKQCQGGQCKSPSSSSQQAGKSAAGNKPAEGDPSNKPARDSTERLAKAGKTDAQDEEDLDELVKQVWGHLPEKIRGQMQNVGVEDFLPKYEKLIEDYYKRLAEEQPRK